MIKDIIVHLDATADDEARLWHAENIARTFEAHITGLYVNVLPDVMIPVDGGVAAASLLADLQEQSRDAAERASVSLRARMAKLGVSNTLQRLEALPGEAADEVAQSVRAADLFVAFRPYAAGREERWPELVEGVLFGSGRAVLLVPDAPLAHSEFRRVLVAWNGTRESARALAEAMPFLRLAETVVLASVGEEASGNPAREPKVQEHLARHGVNVQLRALEDEGEGPAAALLAEARRCGADLIVTGGYGHSRLREWALGGVTRTLFTECPLPLFIAH